MTSLQPTLSPRHRPSPGSTTTTASLPLCFGVLNPAVNYLFSTATYTAIPKPPHSVTPVSTRPPHTTRPRPTPIMFSELPPRATPPNSEPRSRYATIDTKMLFFLLFLLFLFPLTRGDCSLRYIISVTATAVIQQNISSHISIWARERRRLPLKNEQPHHPHPRCSSCSATPSRRSTRRAAHPPAHPRRPEYRSDETTNSPHPRQQFIQRIDRNPRACAYPALFRLYLIHAAVVRRHTHPQSQTDQRHRPL